MFVFLFGFQLSNDIEENLFNLYNREICSKYKNKYRSLVFNIKDEKNNGLFRKILNGHIKPKDLVIFFLIIQLDHFFVRPQHRFVRPLNKGTQLFSTLSYNQEQLPYPSQVFLQLTPWWTGNKPLMFLY